jgi:hypothetical protein
MRSRTYIVFRPDYLVSCEDLEQLGTHRESETEKQGVYESVAQPNRSRNDVPRHEFQGCRQNGKPLDSAQSWLIQ